jgi:hypothetical protein
MIYLSQRDPEWKDRTLGSSKLTIGDYGCTTTCISMLSDYFKPWASPAVIAGHKDFYTKDGLILWGKLDFPHFKFEKRLYGRNDFEIMASVEDKDKAVILEVQIPKGKHWLVCLGKELLGSGYKVVDPWTGLKSSTSKYGNLITGSAHFTRK